MFCLRFVEDPFFSDASQSLRDTNEWSSAVGCVPKNSCLGGVASIFRPVNYILVPTASYYAPAFQLSVKIFFLHD